MLTGNSLVTGAKTIPFHEIVLSSAGDTLTLTKTPVGAITSLYILNTDGTNGTLYTLGTPGTNTEFSISGKTITLPSATVTGSSFKIYYNVTTDATAKTMKVSSDAFGGTFKVVIDVLVRDEYTKADFAGKLIVPCGKFEDSFSFTFAADGDPAVLDLKLECLKDPTTTTMWELVIHDTSLIVAT